MTQTSQFTVRLDRAHQAAVADLRCRLATPLLPTMSIADVLRAGIRALSAVTTAAPNPAMNS